MSIRIQSIHALEILDSRGNPTLSVTVELTNGLKGHSSVPSGVSTGKYEAVELRDHDDARYQGKGVLTAVSHVNAIIAPALQGREIQDRQKELDEFMIHLDGTSLKANLGANAIVGVSQALSCAAAQSHNLPLYAYLSYNKANLLPMPMVNIINGGKHAFNTLDFQEFMIVPIGAPTFSEALRYCVETFNSLRTILLDHPYEVGIGDEGGFAPKLKNNEEACELIVQAIERARFKPGEDIAIALDPAATSFFNTDHYQLRNATHQQKSRELIELYKTWVKKYPIVCIEDGLADTDWQGFHEMTHALGEQIQIVGDDILVTNPEFIRRGIKEKTCNAALIKLNQIGTVTETMEAINLCRQAHWNFVISHRSGETNDSYIADFAVAMGGGQIKTGSVCRGERIAKYNRLLEIEQELGSSAVFVNPLKKQ
jgi:enolase